MRRLTLLFLLAACGSDNKANVDAMHDGPAGPPSCAAYCTAIQANCTAANLQWADTATCMAACAHLPVGTMADMGGDTLGCRLYHANAAHTAPDTHCVHAGPSGAGVCGMPCMGFCDLVVAECPTQYPNAGGCATTCAMFAATPPFTANVTSGDSLSCRLYHASAASTAPALHCPHTAMTSATCQ